MTLTPHRPPGPRRSRSPSRPTARRSMSPTPTTTMSRSSIFATPRHSRVKGFHSDRLVSLPRLRLAGRQTSALSAAAKAWASGRTRRPKSRQDRSMSSAPTPMSARCSMACSPRSKCRRRRQLPPTRGRSMANTPYRDALVMRPRSALPPAAAQRDPLSARRQVADQACALHHQGESHLRSGAGRHEGCQGRPLGNGDPR